MNEEVAAVPLDKKLILAPLEVETQPLAWATVPPAVMPQPALYEGGQPQLGDSS